MERMRSETGDFVASGLGHDAAPPFERLPPAASRNEPAYEKRARRLSVFFLVSEAGFEPAHPLDGH